MTVAEDARVRSRARSPSTERCARWASGRPRSCTSPSASSTTSPRRRSSASRPPGSTATASRRPAPSSRTTDGPVAAGGGRLTGDHTRGRHLRRQRRRSPTSRRSPPASKAGAPAELLSTWFAATLRDGIALAASGSYAGFREVGRANLLQLLPTPEAADHVLDRFARCRSIRTCRTACAPARSRRCASPRSRTARRRLRAGCSSARWSRGAGRALSRRLGGCAAGSPRPTLPARAPSWAWSRPRRSDRRPPLGRPRRETRRPARRLARASGVPGRVFERPDVSARDLPALASSIMST